MILIFFSVALIFFFIHLGDIWKIIDAILKVLTPILYGLVIAYILNYPFKLFYQHAFKNMGKKNKLLSKLRMPLSLILSYIIIFGILTFLVVILIPELTASISKVIENLPVYEKAIKGASDDVVAFVKNLTGYNLYEMTTYSDIIKLITGDSVADFIKTVFTNILPSAWTTVKDIGSIVYNWGLGIVISIYLLSSKDTLLRQSRKLIVAYTPEKFSSRFFSIAAILNNKCGKFIVGKIIDSSIIGVMCFIGMTIFRFDYPLLISFIMGVTNMIPFFGPIFGAVPCALLLLIINPLEALWFVVFIFALQQFDGNILGPKILGETVGISGFWILVSVIAGGGLFGLPGMILGVPFFAAIYTIVRESADRLIAKKKAKAIAAAPAPSAPQESAEPSDDRNNN
jgi:predicted PurR-regulated permease PerM